MTHSITLFFRKDTAEVIEDSLEFMYASWPDNSDKYALRSQLIDLIGDYLYFAPSHEVADITHSRNASVYMYEFAHRSKLSWSAEWMGVVQSSNALYDFGSPLIPSSPFQHDEADKNVSLFIVATYTNFARSGDPTVSGVAWKRYNSSHRAYLRVDENPKMKTSFNPRLMSFWNDYYPKLTQLKFDTRREVVSGVKVGASMVTFYSVTAQRDHVR